MVLTIKDEDGKFSVRVGAIIYNNDLTKVFMQRQGNHKFYMLPGGRLEINEETTPAIKRELIEELGIDEDVYLKFISEGFIQFPNSTYHELGFYIITKIDENKYGYFENEEYDSLDEANDGKSKFKWLDIDKLDEVEIMPNHIKEKIQNKDIKFDNSVEHLIYKEY